MPSPTRTSEREKTQIAGAVPLPGPRTLPPPVERDRLLLAGAHAGEVEAVEGLYRLHLPVARGVAVRLCSNDDADDVVAEAFARVLEQIAQGGGPRVSFRAYLITAVRNAAADLARRNARLVWTHDMDARMAEACTTPGLRPDSTIRHESVLLTQALTALPSRWQLVLWWTAVENRPLTEVGDLLDLNANAAAALAFRARQGLRDAYFRLHVPPAEHADCATFRGGMANATQARTWVSPPSHLADHVESCESCRDMQNDLREIAVSVGCR